MTVPVSGRQSSIQARTDRAVLDFVIDCLKDSLYAPRDFAGPFTDLGCGLSGLELTWRRDILSEADAEGIISLDGLKRIRNKLSAAIIDQRKLMKPVLLDDHGNVLPTTALAGDKERERLICLVEVVERAINIGSTIQCVPSCVREERISQAYARADVSRERTA
jgi:hypothetical protein